MELALTVGGIDSEHSRVILAEGLRKACACAGQETDRGDPGPMLPAKARVRPQTGNLQRYGDPVDAAVVSCH